MKKQILITGGSGFIGTHLINSFLKSESYSIINLDLVNSPISHPCLHTEILDIRNQAELASLDLNEIDFCVHLAALCKEPGFEWDEYFITNHIGTQNVIKLCERLEVKQIIFTSTMMVYKAGEIERAEDSITSSDTAYGISKLLGEKELMNWRDRKIGRKLKIIRPAVVFGENENANFTRLYKSLKRGFFPYVGKSSTVKSSIYVKELTNFIQFLIDKETKNDIFNMSFPEDLSIKATIETFKSVFQMKSFNPVFPYSLLLFISKAFEILNAIGLRNSIHHRRIQKLYYSTNITPKAAIEEEYQFTYTLKTALEDWKKSNDPNF